MLGQEFTPHWIASDSYSNILEINHAYSAPGALQIMRHQRIDILISDISMPGMTGLQLAYIVQEYWPNCITMFLTAYADFEYAKEAVGMSACAYVLKSDSDEAIVAAFKTCIERFNSNLKHVDMIQNLALGCENSLKILKQNALWSILNSSDTAELDQLLLALDFKAEGTFQIVICLADSINTSELYSLVTNSTQKFLNIPNTVSCYMSKNNQLIWLWQIPSAARDEFISRINGAYELLGQHLYKSFGIASSFFISRFESQVSQLSELYLQLEYHAKQLYGDHASGYVWYCQIKFATLDSVYDVTLPVYPVI